MKVPDRVLVVGGVAAGMSAASQIRRRNPKTRVTVFERGNYISYGACGMPYNIEDPEREIEDLVVLTAEQARKKRGIDLRLRHDVTELDLDRRTLTVVDLESGANREEPFDALVIATGARAIRLPLDGFDLPGVEVLRNLDDGAAIKQILNDDPKNAVIVGAGYIGMEMAHVLTERGLSVTVLEKLSQLLPGWHKDTVAVVAETLSNRGVEFHTGAAVKAAEAGPDGRVAAVLTEPGLQFLWLKKGCESETQGQSGSTSSNKPLTRLCGPPETVPRPITGCCGAMPGSRLEQPQTNRDASPAPTSLGWVNGSRESSVRLDS